ncbi:MAG: hypothetical protein ACXWJK_06815 [Burkholderiaceae bacterium]
MNSKKYSKPRSEKKVISTGKRVRTTDRIFTSSIDSQALVRQALENPKFKWRTVQGVAKEAGVDERTVRRLIAELGENVVRSSVPSISGDDLFTTRKHYRESEGVLGRIVAILRNRAA